MKKNKKFKIGISAKLISMFVTLIAVPILVLGIGSYLISTNILKEQFRASTSSLGNEVNRSINSYLDGLEQSLSVMSTDSNVQAILENADSSQWMLKSFKNYIDNYGDVTNIYLGTKDKSMYIYPQAQLSSDYDPTQAEWYNLAVEKQGLAWTQPYIDKATKKLVISAVVPVYNKSNGNEFIGIIGIDVSLDTLSSKITNIKIGKEGYPIVYGKDGLILIHKNKELVGKPSTVKELEDAVKSEDVKYTEYEFNENGKMKKKLAVINNIERLDWKIVSSIYLSELAEQTHTIFRMILIIGGVLLALAVLISYIFSRTITKPIKLLSGNVEKIKNGDFTIMTKVSSGDEIGMLAESFNVMADNLAKLIKSIQQVSVEVTASAQNLAATSEETSASAEEVARTVEEIAKGASEQASDSERGATLVSNLSEKFIRLTSDSDDMHMSAKDVLETSNTSLKVVEELKLKSKMNNEGTITIEEAIMSLDGNIKHIGDILQTIDSIAEQTNLLALNASIEAARAGEHGKGFAVVADEIRKLAYDSRLSSDQIKEIIVNIQQESENTVSIMQDVKKRADEQTVAVEEVNNSFDLISNAIEKITEKIELIANYVIEMNRDKDSIVESIEGISSVSEETAAASEEVTASMQQQSMAVEEVARAADKLNELSLKLNDEINKFKI